MTKQVAVWCGVIAVALIAFFPWHCNDDRKDDDRKHPVVSCWNEYVTHSNAADAFYKSYLVAPSDEERRSRLRRCRDAWDRVRPYEPLGVDPRLAEAIAGCKKVWIERVDFDLREVGVWLPDTYRARQLQANIKAARERLDAAVNQVASEVGDLHFSRDR